MWVEKVGWTRMLFAATDFLREDTMIGTSFLRVAAHDDDFGTNAVITYSMSDEQPEYLRVNPMTGWVYVNQPISQVHTHKHGRYPSSSGENWCVHDDSLMEALQMPPKQLRASCCLSASGNAK